MPQRLITTTFYIYLNINQQGYLHEIVVFVNCLFVSVLIFQYENVPSKKFSGKRQGELLSGIPTLIREPKGTFSGGKYFPRELLLRTTQGTLFKGILPGTFPENFFQGPFLREIFLEGTFFQEIFRGNFLYFTKCTDDEIFKTTG